MKKKGFSNGILVLCFILAYAMVSDVVVGNHTSCIDVKLMEYKEWGK